MSQIQSEIVGVNRSFCEVVKPESFRLEGDIWSYCSQRLVTFGLAEVATEEAASIPFCKENEIARQQTEVRRGSERMGVVPVERRGSLNLIGHH